MTRQATYKVWCDEWQSEHEASHIKADSVRDAVKEYVDGVVEGDEAYTISVRDSSGQLYAVDVEVEVRFEIEVGSAKKVQEK